MEKKPRSDSMVNNKQKKEEQKDNKLRFTDEKRKQKEAKYHTVGGF